MDFIKPKRKVEKVFIHCTAYPHQDLFGQALIDAINRWHVARRFREIGYHYVIDMNGDLLEGRSLESNPAAQRGHNSRSIALCLDGLHFRQFNKKQFTTLRKLANQIDEVYDNEITYHGHCEVSRKECPVFDYPAVLGLDRWGRRVTEFRTSIEKPFDINIPIANRMLLITSKGQDVIRLQAFLNIPKDGMFGTVTHNAVVHFQKQHGLVADGIVGPITWKELLEHNI